MKLNRTNPHKIVPPEKDDISILGGIMADAFFNEPNFTYMLPDERKRRNVLPWFFKATIRAGMYYRVVHRTPDLDGCSVWLGPKNNLSFWPMVRTGLVLLPFKLGLADSQRSMQLNDRLDQDRKLIVPEPHWYLMALGVAPGSQGKGIGSALMQPIVERADDQAVPCYLETFGKNLLDFYDRFGFEVSSEGRIPEDRPYYWTMIRKPGTVSTTTHR